jgi:urease accessory protein
MRLASPSLPVGGFSYSEGLEAAIEAGWATQEADVTRWLLDQFQLTLARADLPVAATAFKAWGHNDLAQLQALNTWIAATREGAELRQQSEQTGRSMTQWLRHEHAGQIAVQAQIEALATLSPAPTWPVAFALAAYHTGAPLYEGMLAMALGWADNMTQAAIKAVPLGQTAAQRILSALISQIPTTVDQALRSADHQRQAFAPMLAILSAQHETQYSRLFRS